MLTVRWRTLLVALALPGGVISFADAWAAPPGTRALNVRTFGAVGDGTANDRAAIQTAVDAARPGATVYFPAGTYRLDDAIKVRHGRLTFAGVGARSVIQHGGVTGLALGTSGEPLSGLVVQRLKFVG